jgi:CRISPR-associated protein Cas2
VRQAYVVSYDISNPKRLRKVYKLMRGYGDHVQFSVFRCELNKRELVELRGKIRALINSAEDQVMFVDIGPAEGRGANCISTLGKPFLYLERYALVV